MTFFSSTSRLAAAALAAVAMTAAVAAVHAQQQQPAGPPNALQGFSQNHDKPIKINAESLEVRDKEKMATFSGDVRLIQGDVKMNSTSLVVFYDDQPPPAQPGPSKNGKPAATAEITPQQQNQQIKRVEAKGGVTVQQKDQTATGETGIFDMRANTVEMKGNVVITRGPNILKGDNLTVDMNTGDSMLTCGQTKKKCAVVGLFVPGSMKQDAAAPAPRPRSVPAHP